MGTERRKGGKKEGEQKRTKGRDGKGREKERRKEGSQGKPHEKSDFYINALRN